jgi:hypothetical protein
MRAGRNITKSVGQAPVNLVPGGWVVSRLRKKGQDMYYVIMVVALVALIVVYFVVRNKKSED